jgi:precorrin-2/cobalt-factor-2 C20-methyltransferase
LPATLDDADLTARLENTEAAAIIKVGRHLPRLRALIEACGLTARATYVEHASRPDEKVLPLANIGNAEAPYFSMILIAPDRHAEQDQARAT